MISKRKKISWTELLIILVIINALGFPGNYVNLLGEQIEAIVEYGSFLVEILLLLLFSNSRFLSIKKRHLPMIIFAGIIFVESVIVTNYFGLEIISCTRLCVTIAFALFLVDRFSSEKILELFYQAQVGFLILTGIYTIFNPSGAFQDTTIISHAFTGLFTTKNNCASELACGIIITMVLIKIHLTHGGKLEKAKILVLGIQIILLISCQATGPILCMLLSVIYVIFLSQRRFNPALFFWVVSLGFLFVSLTVIPLFAEILEFLGKDITLTGRTNMWSQVIEVMTNTHTWTGFGYVMFWRDPSAYGLIHAGFNQYSFLGNMTSGSHNMILDLWLNIGLIGIILLFLLTMITMFRYKKMANEQYLFVSSYMIYFTLHGLTERAFDPSNYLTLLFFVVVATASLSKQAELQGF